MVHSNLLRRNLNESSTPTLWLPMAHTVHVPSQFHTIDQWHNIYIYVSYSPLVKSAIAKLWCMGFA